MEALQAFSRGDSVLYAAPTDPQSNRFWEEIKNNDAILKGIQQSVYLKNETERVIQSMQYPEQAIRCKTAWAPDHFRGDYCDLLILDEYQLMHPEVWRTVCAPMLIDHNGTALFIFTPPSLASRTISKANREPQHAAKLYEKALKDKRWACFSFTSHDNPHISKAALAEISADMTQLSYRQEILAELLTEVPGALWTQKLIDDTRLPPAELPPLIRIVVGVDPSGSSRTEAGIVAAGVDRDGHRYVLRDMSLLAPTPNAWASATVTLYHTMRADRIVGERNYGGDMVESTIRQADANVSYVDVVATRGKLIRAEPIAAAFERHRAHLVGDGFAEMESEMCSFVPGEPSPNRLDAMVWALTELAPDESAWGFFEVFSKTEAQFDAMMTTAAAKRDAMVAYVIHELQAGRQQEAVAAMLKPADDCPNCGGTNLWTGGGAGTRCNDCGKQWDQPQMRVHYASRTEMLAATDGKGWPYALGRKSWWEK